MERTTKKGKRKGRRKEEVKEEGRRRDGNGV
jgi:hypothetical protein